MSDTTTSPIDQVLPFDHDGDDPTGSQSAFIATVRILVPCRDRNGTPVADENDAMDYISETLREQFLDWAYVNQDDPKQITVSEPYVEGTAFQN